MRHNAGAEEVDSDPGLEAKTKRVRTFVMNKICLTYNKQMLKQIFNSIRFFYFKGQRLDEFTGRTVDGHTARYTLTISSRNSGLSFSKYSTPRGRPCALDKCVSTASFNSLVTSSCGRHFFTARTARRYCSS